MRRRGFHRSATVEISRTSRGATAVEYALMVSLIAIVIIGAVTLLGTTLLAMFAAVAGAF